MAKLSYFDFHGGRGETARIAFHIGGIDYVDDRIPFASWPELTPVPTLVFHTWFPSRSYASTPDLPKKVYTFSPSEVGV